MGTERGSSLFRAPPGGVGGMHSSLRCGRSCPVLSGNQKFWSCWLHEPRGRDVGLRRTITLQTLQCCSSEREATFETQGCSRWSESGGQLPSVCKTRRGPLELAELKHSQPHLQRCATSTSLVPADTLSEAR